MHKFSGAWLTDIDDTLIESGETPDDQWIAWLADKIGVLKQNNILWIPMSGVALVKLGPRILYRLPEDLLSHVMYYGGDGSQKYTYSVENRDWTEDKDFNTVFSDAQGIALLGIHDYRGALEDIYRDNGMSTDPVLPRLEKAQNRLKKQNFPIETGLLDLLKEELESNGYDPARAELYFRGGSISWMIFGDISAEPYKEEKARRVRKEIMAFAAEWLEKHKGLESLGDRPISIPFPGARGIKFVLIGNDKEKATRNIISHEGVLPETILFTGNEIFEGGNDNMIRNIDGITLLSVGEKTDEGPNVISGGVGVDANSKWLESLCVELQKGVPWSELLMRLRND